MLGITFKENCPDVRNTKIVDVISSLEEYGITITTYDPWANPAEVKHEYKIESTKEIPNQKFDAVVLGVSHKEFLQLDIHTLQNENSVLYDVKGILGNNVDGKL
jgi:UDP-N-acetyl-D-galactosamine dehydrogenase